MWAQVIFNPNAGGGRASPIDDAVTVLRDAGWRVTVTTTVAPGDATLLAAEAAANGVDLVLAAGGDGTVNEALQPLVGARTALSVLPVGTANLLARDMRLPLRLVDAAKALVAGGPRRVDVGRAGGARYFLLFAGLGFDAALVNAVDADLKRWLGPWSFVAAAARIAPSYQGARTALRLNGEIRRRRALMVVIANTRLFALFPLTEDAETHDGLFDVWVFHGSGVWTKVRHLVALLLRQQRQAPNIDQARARRVEVRARPRLPVQLDGEPWGYTPMTFEIVPRAMTLWLPNTAPTTLFGEDVARASATEETNQSAR